MGSYCPARMHISHFTREELTGWLRAASSDILNCRYVGFCEMIFKARKPRPPRDRS